MRWIYKHQVDKTFSLFTDYTCSTGVQIIAEIKVSAKSFNVDIKTLGEMYRRWTSELIGFIKGVTTSSEARRSLMSPVHDILISDDSNPWKGVFS
jgi:hypothetical protein